MGDEMERSLLGSTSGSQRCGLREECGVDTVLGDEPSVRAGSYGFHVGGSEAKPECLRVCQIPDRVHRSMIWIEDSNLNSSIPHCSRELAVLRVDDHEEAEIRMRTHYLNASVDATPFVEH